MRSGALRYLRFFDISTTSETERHQKKSCPFLYKKEQTCSVGPIKSVYYWNVQFSYTNRLEIGVVCNAPTAFDLVRNNNFLV